MALRGSRIENFDELWCLVASRGLEICVLSTSFQKNDIDWPQQPQTERVLKFNMTFHNSTTIFFFKHKNKTEFKCLDDFEVLSSDFSGLKTSAASMTSVASAASMASMTSTASFHQKKPTDPDDLIISSTQMTNTCLLYTSPSPRDATLSRMPSSA